jgi:lipopolysaccharide transport system ATP-binding protein
MTQESPVIQAQGLRKVYHKGAFDMALDVARNLLRPGSGSTAKPGTSHAAVDGVDLVVHEGERVGIIGENGAGKSTLLELLSGLSSMTEGTIQVRGNVQCIMTLGVALNDELSGYENIRVDGEIRNLPAAEIEESIPLIAAFSELGDFLDQPVRTYSSGMKARLGFAIATHLSPEVLIIDEALSVGDLEFNRRAAVRVRELSRKGKVFLLVSHSMDAIRSLTTRCLWMENGKICMDGSSEEVTRAYEMDSKAKEAADLASRFQSRVGSESLVEGCKIHSVEILGKDHIPTGSSHVGDSLTLKIRTQWNPEISEVDLEILWERSDGLVLLRRRASQDGLNLPATQGGGVLCLELPDNPMGPDVYELQVRLLEPQVDSPPRELARHTSMHQILGGSACLARAWYQSGSVQVLSPKKSTVP